MAGEPEPIVLRCRDCGLPWARIADGALIVVSRHHGTRHENGITVAELAALLEKARAAAEEVMQTQLVSK